MALNDEDVREILRIIDESDLAELRIETDGLLLHVRRGVGTETMSSPEGSTAPASGAAQAGPKGDTPPATMTATDRHDGKLTIKSPMLGTFYRAEGPGQKPFVEVGSKVEPDSTVCIIEVMKMMNSVPAGVAGTIAEVCHENSQLVEHAAPLFRVEPATRRPAKG